LAAALLAATLPFVEPAAVFSSARSKAQTYEFRPTVNALACILLSAVLGLLVTLSTFLVIGATSALTYNVVGHIKTVGVITGGVLIYGDVRFLPVLPQLAQLSIAHL
jgi:solute carrier family 35 protein E3